MAHLTGNLGISFASSSDPDSTLRDLGLDIIRSYGFVFAIRVASIEHGGASEMNAPFMGAFWHCIK